MDFSRMTGVLENQFPSRLQTIDSHTAGEVTRLIIGGVEPIPGDTMKDKLHYFETNMDHIRLLLTREPRGRRGMMAALITEPVSKGADFGLIYMDDRRCPYLCGHATIGAVMTLIEAGVQVLPPGCGICGQIMLNDQVGIAAVPRNSHGRFGGAQSDEAQMYLAGPATVAASAIAGRIVDPKEMLDA